MDQVSIFKKTYTTAAEVAAVVEQAKDVKDIANLYYINAELVENAPELKARITELKNQFYQSQPRLEEPYESRFVAPPKPSNPEAFPSPATVIGERCYMEPSAGMSLGDYFAAHAMQAMVAGDGARMVAARDERYNETNWAEIVASNAYDFANAMLAEREKRIKHG